MQPIVKAGLACAILSVLALSATTAVNAQNAVSNPGFEVVNSSLLGPDYATSTLSTAASSASDWTIYNNNPFLTSTDLATPSTDPFSDGQNYMIHVKTGAGSNGIYQVFGAIPQAVASVDVFVVSGHVSLYLYTNSGQSQVGAASSTVTGKWEHLQIALTGTSVNEVVLYSSPGSGVEFYADNVFVGPSFPRAEVPEPSQTAALSIGALGLFGLGFAARRRRMASAR